MLEPGNVLAWMVGILTIVDILVRTRAQPQHRELSINVVLSLGPIALLLFACLLTFTTRSYFLVALLVTIAMTLNIASWIQLPGEPRRIDTGVLIGVSSLTSVVIAVAFIAGIASYAVDVTKKYVADSIDDRASPSTESGRILQRNGSTTEAISAENHEPRVIVAPTVEKIEPAAEYRPQQHDAAEKSGSASAAWWGWFNATAVTAFTLGIVILGGLQWWAMHEQSKFMESGLTLTRAATRAATKGTRISMQTLKQMRREQRPWLCAKEVARVRAIKAGYSCRIIVKNVGQIPAIITGYNMTPVVATKDDIHESIDENLGGRFVDSEVDYSLPPGSTLPMYDDIPMPEFRAEGIAKGYERMAMLFSITYRGANKEDVFVTRECFSYNRKTGKAKLLSGYSHIE